MGEKGDEDYIVYGTPLVRVEDVSRRKGKLAVDQGQARRVAPWKEEVTDAEGRRRFHGAFSGGYSAGYFNTVGSKEGWEPKSFSSSRTSRAEQKGQSAFDFMDEDEKAELEAKEFGISSAYDTFGFTAAEIARKKAAKEAFKRPSIIPGPIPDEIVVPAIQSVGVKLLMKMGWRPGRAIGSSQLAASSDARRQARKALVALSNSNEMEVMPKKMYSVEMPPAWVTNSESKYQEDANEETVEVPRTTPVFVLNPKNDVHGLGFDPFKNAPEFRERKRACLEQDSKEVGQANWKEPLQSLRKPSLFRPQAGKMGSGFGIGALEEMGEEDEDVYASEVLDIQEVEEKETPIVSGRTRFESLSGSKKDGCLPGFTPASSDGTNVQPQRFPSPIVPADFVPYHKFSAPLYSEHLLSKPEPPEVPAPQASQVCKIIEGLATFVARSGLRFEELSRERHRENPLFSFLFGGPGHDYYSRKLWEEQKKVVVQAKDVIPLQLKGTETERLDAAQRGRILGEIPLPKEQIPIALMIAPEDRARLQAALSSTFTNSSSEGVDASSVLVYFKDDPAKQARFEQFLKEKSLGGLRNSDVGGLKSMSEVQRAHEIFEFENASCFLKKEAGPSGLPSQALADLTKILENKFTSGNIHQTSALGTGEEITNNVTVNEEMVKYPKRGECPWRPSTLLCKRFNLLDPYAGKPPLVPRPGSRTESLTLITNSLESAPKSLLALTAPPVPEHFGPQSGVTTNDASNLQSNVAEVVDIITEKPVDLYKAIFSDDEDDEKLLETSHLLSFMDEGSSGKQSDAAQAALNRLVAGDFLESLGKELGLRVPSEEKPSVQLNFLSSQQDFSIIGNRNPTRDLTEDGDKLPTSDTVLRTAHLESQEGSVSQGLQYRSTSGSLLLRKTHVGNLSSPVRKNQEADKDPLAKVGRDHRKRPLHHNSDSDESGSKIASHRRGSKEERRKDRRDSRKHKHHSKKSHDRQMKKKKETAGESKAKHHHRKHRKSFSPSSSSSD